MAMSYFGNRVSRPTPSVPQADHHTDARYFGRLMRTATGIHAVLLIVLFGMFMVTGWNQQLRDQLILMLPTLDVGSSWHPLLVAAYVTTIYWGTRILVFPIAIFRGFLMPRKFRLSTRRFTSWLRDATVGTVLAYGILLATFELMYSLTSLSPLYWWLVLARIASLTSVLLMYLVPVIVLPLYFRTRPITDPAVQYRIEQLLNQSGHKSISVLTIDQSTKSRVANAMFMGAGRTRRVVITDTLLSEFSQDELGVVVAHELGHLEHRDLLWLTASEVAMLTACLGLSNLLLPTLIGVTKSGAGMSDVATMPLVLALFAALSLVLLPIRNAFSRHIEHRADEYALELTGDSAAFSQAMKRLAAQNLAVETPSRCAEILFHDHPSISSRIRFAEYWQTARRHTTDR